MISKKKGQLTIFIIVGIILVASIIVIFFVMRNSPKTNVSSYLQKGEDAYIVCISDLAKEGIALAGQHGGFIYSDELEFYPGSEFSPTSSQLDFYGTPVPYWYYLSGNNILREQKPTMSQIESDLERYIYEGVSSCNFKKLSIDGMNVDISDGEIDVKINKRDVSITSKMPVYISTENESAYVNSHKVKINSKLGEFYDLATKVLDSEKETTFLEYYALDVMRLYAPVTGVEFGCVPKIFNEIEVKQNISNALELNFAQLKLNGSYYSLSNSRNSYYVVDIGEKVNTNVNFMYSHSWPTKIEMNGDKVIQPIGMQEGMGMLGFCLTQYHFVYDIISPVLVQFYDENEVFQFGMVSVIKNSQARNAVHGSDAVSISSGICESANQEIKINTYDINLNPIEANIVFSCLDDSCHVGKTKISSGESTLIGKVPQCLNAVVKASAEGYVPEKSIISTNSENEVDIILKKIHNIDVEISSNDNIVIMFSTDGYSTALNYPSQKSVGLVEGDYDITAFVYSNASINFPGVKDKKCMNIPSKGISGIFGMTENKCFDVDIPAQTISSALVGGGRAYDYYSDDMLFYSSKMKISVPKFGTPSRMDELENNYAKLEISRVDINLEI